MMSLMELNRATIPFLVCLRKYGNDMEEIDAIMNSHCIILDDALPPKEKDLGSLTLPCYINNMSFNKALADLGASFSVMPDSTFTNLGLGELAPTKLIVKLADKTMKRPKGIAENMLVGIDKFVFPLEFIVLDMLEDIKVPLPLMLIDVFERKIAFRIGNDKILFKSDNHTSNIIKKVYVLGLRERMELNLEATLMGKALVINRSQDPEFGAFLKLNDLNEPLELKRNQEVNNLGPTIEDGEVINIPMVDIVKTRHDDENIKGINEYPNVIVGKLFYKASCVEARRFDGLITIHAGNDNVTYQMARSHPRFKHLTNAQCNKIQPLLKVSARDKLEGISYPYQKHKSFYKGGLKLGPGYI
nr:hypothetical protein [Tanacetum cinerariifolium]